MSTRTRPPQVKAPRLRRSSNGTLMTPEEFDAVEHWDELYHFELIRGVVIVSPPPAEGERDPNEELGYWLRRYRDDHPLGASLDRTLSEGQIYLPDSRRRADRVIWAGLGRLPDPRVDAPTIAVEFVSRSRRDRERDYEEKRREYLDLGVAEYWIIDRFRREMIVHRRPPAVPAVQVIPAEGVYQTPLLPGFELRLSLLLKLSDDWKKPKSR